jgi:hypothetical protein
VGARLVNVPNRKQHRAFCTGCGKPREAGERFSARGRCASCGEGRAIANARELRAHSGPAFERWRRAVAASVGGVLAEDVLRESFGDG